MVKQCWNCKHFKQTSGIKNYDGGYPGNCNAPIPLWVEYLYGNRPMDRKMHTTQTADECASFAEAKSGE